ncbi:MAG: nitrite reductase large subunit NirB, partial [Nocardioidaceae bacterium]
MTHLRRTLVLAGHGMVGHRLVQAAVERGLTERYDIVVVGEEPRPAYDRVALTSFFEVGGDELSLLPEGRYDDPRVRLRLGTSVTAVDRDRRTVTLSDGDTLGYDVLVLATGSRPFVPPVPGHDLDGCFVYRTIEDLEAIRDAAQDARSGAVIGGGLLGLEAANALVSLGLRTHVVEMAPRLMPVQLDEAGGAALVRHVERLGVDVHCGAATRRVLGADRATGLELDGGTVDADLVVFSAGVRPRDDLARAAGLEVAERGGVLVDESCRTADPHVYAIGECAAPGGRMYGLVAPGYDMAEVVVDRLLGGDGAFTGADLSTKLKLLGVDVASFGDAFATTEGALELVLADAVAGVYKKLVVSADATRLLGGILVGDASAYVLLRPMVASGIPLPENPEELILPAARGTAPIGMPDEAVVCSCNNVTKAAICGAVDDGGCDTVACLKKCTRAGTTCGSCVPMLKNLVDERLAAAGKAVATGICEHFELSRQELFDVIAVHGYTRFDQIVEAHGRGRGCDVCKPAIASILASQLNHHVLGDAVALQDTNDAYLANIQRNGTYSVVPRIPGGEITP